MLNCKEKPQQSTGNDRYSGKNGQGFLFHYSGCFHYSGRLLYGTQNISSPSFNSRGWIDIEEKGKYSAADAAEPVKDNL